LQALQRDAEWFEPWVTDTPLGPDQPPPKPAVGAVKTDPQGRLWVLVLVPAEDWRDGLVSREWGWDIDVYRAFDQILEVIDPESGELLVSRRFPDHDFIGFLGDDMVVSYREDEMGYPFLDIWRIALVGS
jgi:hypothetical protein